MEIDLCLKVMPRKETRSLRHVDVQPWPEGLEQVRGRLFPLAVWSGAMAAPQGNFSRQPILETYFLNLLLYNSELLYDIWHYTQYDLSEG
jgi:hypothetical protein